MRHEKKLEGVHEHREATGCDHHHMLFEGQKGTQKLEGKRTEYIGLWTQSRIARKKEINVCVDAVSVGVGLNVVAQPFLGQRLYRRHVEVGVSHGEVKLSRFPIWRDRRYQLFWGLSFRIGKTPICFRQIGRQ